MALIARRAAPTGASGIFATSRAPGSDAARYFTMAKALRRARRYATALVRETAQLPLFLLSGLLPRSKTIWLFGAWHGDRYADNTRYLFEYVCRNCPEITAAWLSNSDQVVATVRSSGFRAYRFGSLQAIWLAMRAGALFITHDPNDAGGALTRGATVINLTHGTPLKRLGRDAPSNRLGPMTRLFDRHFRAMLPGYRKPDYIIAASEIARARFASAYGVQCDRVMALGYARWEPIKLSSKQTLVKLGIVAPSERFAKTILYAPTQRLSGRGEANPLELDGFAAMTEWLKRDNHLLLIRPHVSLLLTDQEEITRRGDGHIRFVGADALPDVNAILGGVDLLVTDYSSIMFDFAVLGRPIVHLAYDLDSYVNQDAGFYAPYEDEVAGPIITSWAELPEAARLSLADPVYRERISRFRELHGSLYGRDNCKDMVKWVATATGLGSAKLPSLASSA